MNILLLTYFFKPDFSAGSFRMQALLDSLIKQDFVNEIYIITTMPNRYSNNEASNVKQYEEKIVNNKTIRIFRSTSLIHNNRLYIQIFSFILFSIKSIYISIKLRRKINFIFATSSRFGTAMIGFLISKLIRKKVNIDIRDIFSDSLNVLSNKGYFIRVLSYLFRKIERFVFKRVDSISYVSKGFKEDLSILNSNQKLFFSPNGIDKVFIEFFNKNKHQKLNKKSPFNITYAGNIGYGQGLHLIVPQIAKHFKGKINFTIIGNGNAINILNDKISLYQTNNIQMKKPINRSELIEYYHNADILFLHLGKEDAFKKVLPSKIFEYAVFDKPILAGVSGNARQFMDKEIPNSFVFEPGNLEEAEIKINQIINDISYTRRKDFIEKYDREKLMNNLCLFIKNNAKI